ncbi:MAG: tetratricopeptide repeat protein, partial [Gemmatimonadaceae bacterium]
MTRRACVVLSAAAFIAAIGCREKPASVEDLYTTRMLGLSYLQRDQLPEAEASFKKLTELAPNDPLGYASLGLTYLEAARYDDAEKQLRKARELDPTNSETGLALAKLYSLTGRAAESRKLLEQLRRDSTGNARVLYALAELDTLPRDSVAGAAYHSRLRDVLAVAPANLAVRLKLIGAFVRSGQADSAVQQLEEVRRIPPEPPKEARASLDSTIQLLRSGKIGEARRTLDRFIGLMEMTALYQAS